MQQLLLKVQVSEGFYIMDCEELKYDIPVHRSSLVTFPQEFLPGHISLKISVICQPTQSHLPLFPLPSLASLPAYPYVQIFLNFFMLNRPATS